ncbi:MAG: asparagine synthase (glutamine-hydrolyzing), partial [Armatimonadota bacterium]|nr:asparagine synthase (glutamine-hydrolyzing) [Armatimonadota bacterium]
MCGICGILSKRAGQPVDPDLLQRMNQVLRHRGPDDAGSWNATPAVALAMRRLAIIDLVTGHQPMCNEDGTLHLVFNGEIYNFRQLRTQLQARGHVFATASDTETLLHAYEEYGLDCVHHFNGMFAFAVWDERRQRLLLARDPFGIKPLYYTETPDRLLWASEIKALLQDPQVVRRVDHEALHHYLSFLYVPSPRTMFQGIHKLPPGHRLIWERGVLTLEEYWSGPTAYVNPDARAAAKTYSFPGAPVGASRSVADQANGALSRLLQTLGDAVQSQLVSDVPLGAFLSGGIDSTAVVALMADRMDQPVQTFSIGFRAAGLYDELKWARMAADAFRTDHHEFIVDPGTVELLPRIVWHLDEPLADASAIPNFLVAQMARRFVTVALTGIGGDELFGGYRRYYADALARRWTENPLARFAGRAAVRPLLGILPAGGHAPLHDAVRLARKFFDHLDRDPEARYVAWNASFTPEMKARLYTPGFRPPHWPYSHDLMRPYFARVAHLPFAERAMFVDMKTYLPEDPLMLADKMTMANSLESRVPFLDPAVVEFAAALPLHAKLHGRQTKALLRHALRGRVPAALLDRPKHGFGTPIDLWLRRELHDLAQHLLGPQVLAERGYFRPDAVRELLQSHRAGRTDVSQHLWALLILEIWHRIYIDRDYSARADLTFADLDLPRVTPAPPVSPRGQEPLARGSAPTVTTKPPGDAPASLGILMVSDVDPVNVASGAERMLSEHSRRLAARGHHVVVLTRGEDPHRPTHELWDGVHIYRHPLNPGNPLMFVRSVLREGGRMFQQVHRRHSIDLINVHQPLAGASVLQLPEASAYPCVYTFLSPWAEEYRIRSARRPGATPSL